MTDYAIMVMVQLHLRSGEVLSAQALADAAQLELPTVSKVLKLLVKTGLVVSYRGAAGGYSLLRKAQDVSVVEIIEAIEGPIAMTECSIEEGICAQESKCSLRGNWQRISLAISEAMRGVSLAEMAQPVKPLVSGPSSSKASTPKASNAATSTLKPSTLKPSTLKPSTLKITTANL